MKQKLFSSLLVMLSVSFNANAALVTDSTNSAFSGATVETFNGLSQGYYDSLSVSGATIVGSGSPMRVLNDRNSSLYGMDGNALQNYSGRPSSFDIIFDSTVDAFGIWGGAYNSNWTWSAYDQFDNLIESVNVGTSCCTPLFFGLINPEMKKVTLSGFGDWVVFDNLTFTPNDLSAVPVPTAAALFLPALLGFVGLRRKAKKV